ncbi:MAG: rRNA maturation RNase YbeY [Candidatus Omnitrophota bacterium]|nr:rRNA maturation RNase YbeY [Candidatus Omnitrophota bacterium]
MRVKTVKIVNLNRRYELNCAAIKKIVSHVLRYIKKIGAAELEIVFLDNRAISSLNKKYKNRPRPTDVLSFRIERLEFGYRLFFGEIFISVDRAAENSIVFGTDVAEEVTLYVIHGVLHLFGYDDETTSDKARMSRKESSILKFIRKKEDLSKVLMPR